MGHGQGSRRQRVGELMRTVIAETILKDIKDPRLGFATVTGVEVAADYRDANVYVSVYGTRKEKKATIFALSNAHGFIQYKLGSELDMKFTPRLHFKLDESIEKAMEVDKIFRQLDEENSENEPEEQPDNADGADENDSE